MKKKEVQAPFCFVCGETLSGSAAHMAEHPFCSAKCEAIFNEDTDDDDSEPGSLFDRRVA